MNMSVSRWLPGKQSTVRNQGTRSQFPDDPNAFCFRMESEGVTSQGVVPLPVTSRPPLPPFATTWWYRLASGEVAFGRANGRKEFKCQFVDVM